MQSARRAWHIGDILSVITGFNVSPRGKQALRDIANYMMSATLSDAQHSACAFPVTRAVGYQYPELLRFETDCPFPAELIPEWLRRRAAEFGEYLPLTPLPIDHPDRVKVLRHVEAGD